MKTYIVIFSLALASTGVAALNVPIFVANMTAQNAARQAQATAQQNAARQAQAAQAAQAAKAASAPKGTK